MLVYFSVPLGVACGGGLSMVWMYVLDAPDPTRIPHYHTSVILFYCSGLVELTSEPLWLIGQSFLFIKLRVSGRTSLAYTTTKNNMKRDYTPVLWSQNFKSAVNRLPEVTRIRCGLAELLPTLPG